MKIWAGILLCVVTAVPALAADPIKIGVSGPYSGGSAPGGISMRDGVRLAAAEINAKGGVLGRPLVLIERDDEAKNDVGVQIAQELINKEKVIANVGYVNTGVGLASHRFYQEAEIPVIVNCATGSILTRQFLPPDYEANYVFRVAASDLIQSAMIVEEAVKRQGFSKPAIFADSTNYGQLGKVDLTNALAKYGVTPLVVEKFNIGDTDMTSQLLHARQAGADVILAYSLGPELAQIANGMAKLGWKAPIIGSWALSAISFIDTAGKNGNGAMMPETFIQAPSTPKRKAFIEAYQKAYAVERIPQAVAAAQGYDSIYLLAAAIRQAGSTDGRKIRAALENLQEKVDGVVTLYDHPFTASDHEAISDNIAIFGVVKDGWVVPAHDEDIIGDKAVRVKAKLP